MAPEINEDNLIKNPCIVEAGNGKFYIIWKVSWSTKGISYTSFKNLIDWSEQKYIPVIHHEVDVMNS